MGRHEASREVRAFDAMGDSIEDILINQGTDNVSAKFTGKTKAKWQ